MPIGIGLALLISALAGGGASVAAAKMGSSAASKGQRMALDANDRAIAFERERDARDYAQYLKELERTNRLQDEDRLRINTLVDQYEGRRAPFRQAGANAHKQLAGLLTLPNGYQQPGPISPASRKLSELVR